MGAVRQGLLARGFDVVMPTYGLHRGLVLLSASIASAQHRFATCLDGAEMMGTRLSPDHRFAHPAPLFFCGASAVTAAGIRFGMGAGYIDVEWWICRALGLANEGTEVVAVVDRCQVSDARFAPEVDELPCTYIATQDGLLATGATARPSRPPKLDFDPSLAANPQVLAAFALLSDGD